MSYPMSCLSNNISVSDSFATIRRLCRTGNVGQRRITKRTERLPPKLVKSRSREIGCFNDRIAPKFDRHLDGAVTDMPVKFQSERKRLNSNPAASRLHEILR